MMNSTEYAAIGETLHTAVLPSGLSIRVVTKPGYRRRFAVLAVHYGGADRRFSLDGKATATPAGVAHYLEHKMFDMPEGDALMTLSAAGADPNAFTSEDMTAYYFECTDRFDEDLRTLLRFVSTPWFTQESVDKERGIIAQEIRMYEDNPDSAVYENLMKLLFRDHPLRDNVAGTVESIARITPEQLYNCHRAFYRPSNMTLCVVGDVDPEAVEKAALELLPTESSPLPLRDYGPEEPLLPAVPLREVRMAVAAPIFMLGARLGPASTGDMALRDRLISGLALRCLCGRSSPFYIKHYGSGLLNATFGGGTDYAAGQGIVTFSGETPRSPQEVRDALCAEILRVSGAGFDPALFSRQKKAVLGGFIRALGNFHSLGVSMAEGVFEGYCPLDTLRLLEGISCEDAAGWVRAHLAPESLAMSVVLPREE